MQAYGYIRAAVGLTNQEGVDNLSSQRKRIKRFASARGFRLAHVFCENAALIAEEVSVRPVGQQLLATLRRRDVVVIPTLDRLFLTADDTQRVITFFLEREIQLFSADLGMNVATGPVKKVLVALQVAELERRSLQMRLAKQKQRQLGKFSGGTVPFGFRSLGGELVELQNEQQAIRDAQKWHAEKRSYRYIANRLNRRNGITVSHVTVRRILCSITLTTKSPDETELLVSHADTAHAKPAPRRTP